MKNVTPDDLELTYESNYLTDDFYTRLLEDRDAMRDAAISTDHGVVAECVALLNYEARLLDQRSYDRWLDLYTRDAIYWIPQDDAVDIRAHANLMFDDRRRMEDRVLRLLSKYAHSQVPERRFQRLVSNVEAWQLTDGRRRVFSSQIAYEYRRGHELDRYVYRTDHTLRQEGEQWKIAVKRCILINIDHAMEPPTLL